MSPVSLLWVLVSSTSSPIPAVTSGGSPQGAGHGGVMGGSW